jgi:hypothetical protein
MPIEKEKIIRFYVPNTALTRAELIKYHIPEDVVDASLGKKLYGKPGQSADVKSVAKPGQPVDHKAFGWWFPHEAIEIK